MYLEPLWNSLADLYRFYMTEICNADVQPLSQCAFEQTFNEKRLRIFRRRKDECETCLSYRMGNITTEEYDEHRTMKEEARLEEEKDKACHQHRVFCMDVQSVLLCPLNHSSAMYYKTKLVNHNFTIYDLHSAKVWCYLWNETNATLQSTTFASMLADFLINHSGCKAGDTVIFYSDGCTYQNRNAQVSNALLHVAAHLGITIVQKFFHKGHSQMEADSVHSTIETKIKNEEICVPADYCRLIREARLRNPYTVFYIDYTFFRLFNTFVTSIRPPKPTDARSEHPKFVNISALKYCLSGDMFYKLKFSEDFKPFLMVGTRSRSSMSLVFTSFSDLPRVYNAQLKIPKTKYDHLQGVLPSIPRNYHSFYTDLPH